MHAWNTVAIVGVGLIGGSIGLALRERRLVGRVIGIGRRADSLQTAQRLGAIDDHTTDLAQGAAEADLTVICTPVERIVEQAQTVAAVCPAGALITDAGSTKARIVRELERSLDRRAAFIGSHPLAGSEKTGPESASSQLYRGRVVVITPTAGTMPDQLRRLASFWESLGARVVVMGPEEHDRALAATSHLPHLIASALAAATPQDRLELTATGWADTTRVAAGDAELWTQIFQANRANLLLALDEFEACLARLRQAIDGSKTEELTRLLQEAKRVRDAVGS